MNSFTAQDISFMQRAIELAGGGKYTAHPNPCVGSVLVKNGKVVGEGFHAYFGGDHAEIMALKQAGSDARDATCYVTLEPCSHFGKTPPCVNALIEAGVKKVVIASLDPNPEVNGKGLKKLVANNIEVKTGLLALHAQQLNPAFYHRMQKQKPYVVMKSAMSMDARTATKDGESKWITGEKARAKVQSLRAHADAVITGIETVLADNPAMTVRDKNIKDGMHFRQPKRIILDTQLRIPLQANILRQVGETIIVTSSNNLEKVKQLQETGVSVWKMQGGSIDLATLMQRLIEAECYHVLVEAGGTLSGAFWKAGLVNEWHVFIAPKLLGANGRPVLNFEVPTLAAAPSLELASNSMAGEDFHLVFKPKSQREPESCLQA